MDYDKLIEQLKKSADFEDYPVVASFAAIIEKKYLREAATALSTLQAENEKLRNEVERQRRSADDRKHLYENAERAYMKVVAELEQVKAERDAAVKKYEAEKEDFLDYALSGTQNAAPFCRNRHPDCVDKRGWCIPVRCRGFSRDKED